MLARVRATAGRVATVAGATVLTGGLSNDAFTLPGTLAIAVTAGLGLAANIKILRAPIAARGTAIAVYVAPHIGCATVLIGERLVPESPVAVLVQAAVVALWTGATWYLRPGFLARKVVDEAVAQEIAEAAAAVESEAEEAAVEAPVYANPQARWWGEHVAVEGGVAPGTVLLEHRQVSEGCLALVVGAEQRGRAVPDIPVAGLSALLDLPEHLIEIGPVPGRGAGVRLLVLGERPQPVDAEKGDSDAEVWAEIAATAMPGVELVEATTYEVHKELI
ncbi:hypothetical protein ACFU98_42560 [Streptomyces sp. NPDC057575]|uniref:hypothetical protein n=1 Tax=unclassified Streptomyces TaxID=2593676 RepID=UPI0036A3EBBA